MEKIISTFVAMHLKKSYKGHAGGMFINFNQKPKTLYRVFINLSFFGNINEKFEDLQSLFLLFKKHSDKMIEIFKNDTFIKKYISFWISKSNNLNEYIEKINKNRSEYDLYIHIINTFCLSFSNHFNNEIKQIINKKILNSKKVFIGIQFSEDYKEIAEIIKSAIQECNLIPVKIDEIEHNDLITDVLKEQMDQADLGIFELSSLNSNVFYEAGYLDGQRKPTILVSKNDNKLKIPFDVYAKNRVIYESHEQLKEGLIKRIKHVLSPQNQETFLTNYIS